MRAEDKRLPNKETNPLQKLELKRSKERYDKHFPPIPNSGPTPSKAGILVKGVDRKLCRATPERSKRLHGLIRRMPTPSFDSLSTGESLEEQSSLMAELVDPNTIYRFRLTSGITINTSSGGGVLSGYETADPSGGGTWTASEWSNIITLFSEVRVVSFALHYTITGSTDTNTMIGNTPYLGMSGSLTTLVAAPTSFPVVVDNADGININPYPRFDGGFTTFKVKYKTPVSWAATSAPNPGAFAGCPGSIGWYGADFPNTQAIASYWIEGIYEFRNRI
jgi:hypothetical protein